MAGAPPDNNAVTRVHVLTLSAESAHVRSIARSWAAGEVSVDDYRMIRSMTIEGMLNGDFATGGPGDAPGSEAQQASNVLFDDEDDQDTTAVGDQVVTASGDIHPHSESVGKPAVVPTEQSVPRVALMAGAVLLVLGLIMLFALV